MATILDKIATYKREEVAAAKARLPLQVVAEYARSAEPVRPFAGAIRARLAAGKPALIEVRIDPEAISPNTTLSAIRQAALK